MDGLVRAPLDAGTAAFAVSSIDVDPFVTDIGNVITRQSALGISHQPIYFFFLPMPTMVESTPGRPVT